MLEQELASIIKFTLDRAGNPSPYYWNVQENFCVPAAYFPYAGDYDRRRNATDVFYVLRMVYHVFPPYGAGGVCSWAFSSYGD